MYKSDNIVIVGGGSAGWITASFLIKTFPEKNITLIESPTAPVVGVGESTQLDVTNFRDYLGIEEKDFMRYTDASYKMSIRFNDFYEINDGGFHYPFRTPDLTGTKLGLSDWLEIKSFYPETEVQDFARCYFPHMYLIENNKYMINDGSLGTWSNQRDVVYHFDAIKFGSWLREKYCIPRGVKRIVDDVIDAKVSEKGIEYLILSNGTKQHADLFIDCTGFKSLLLGQYLNEPFDNYNDILPNNRAWATQIDYLDKDLELQGFTDSTAIENGWVWNIPLWSRIGSGYVYSDKYISPEDALEQYKKHLMSNKMVIPRTRDQVDSFEYKDIPMRIGIHKRTWVKNVVALGLSAGFVEPLESNGLFSVLWFVSKLAKSLQRNHISKLDRDIYNAATRGLFENLVEFIALHYALSIRRDTQYWIDISETTFSKEMINLEPINKVGIFDLQDRKMFSHQPDPDRGITYIAVGMNYPMFDSIDQRLYTFGRDLSEYIDSNKEFFRRNKERWFRASITAPTLNSWLEENIYNDY